MLFKLKTDIKKYKTFFIFLTVCLILISVLIYFVSQNIFAYNKINSLNKTIVNIQKELKKTLSELSFLRNQNQYVINQKLQEEIDNIQKTYAHAVTSYEKLLAFKEKSKNTTDLDKLFALSLKDLSERNYSSSEATLTSLDHHIQEEENKLSQSISIPQNTIASNTPPNTGFSSQSVQTDAGSFLLSIIAADLNTTRVIVDTASDNDCRDNCPALPLADYVARSGAFAGINGSFFCPPEYPSCAGKTNSFDLLAMNKNKHYLNSDNNIYSTNPAVIFGGSWVRFVGHGSEWGRDTGVDGVLMNYPLLIQGKQIVYNGSSDGKFNGKGVRNFVANKGNVVYIGSIYNATMSDSAQVLHALDMENAMNLDEGGSTALWYGGYKLGPGRNIPNAILFVRK